MRKLVTCSLCLLLCCGVALAQKSSSGSSSSRSPGSSSGSRSYSSGSSSTPKPSSPSYSKPPASSGASKSYSSGKPTPSKPDAPHVSHQTSTSKPPTVKSDAASRAQQAQESRAAYKAAQQKGEAPKTEYKAANGTTVKIDPKDRKIERLRNQLDHEKFANRELRTQNFYSSYYNRPPLFSPYVHYHDPYNAIFFLWLMDRSLNERALWCYNHRYDMDDARYQELLRKDAQLENRLRQLERENRSRDNSYSIAGVDADLQYNDEYVEAVYNPAPTHTTVVARDSESRSIALAWWLLGLTFVGIIGVTLWAIFIREV